MDSSYQQRKAILMNIILYERKQQAIKISSFLKNKLIQKIKIKKFILQQKIINNILLLQKNIRGYCIRKKITDYLSKIRTSYLIKTGIEDKIKNLQMIVFFKNKNKIFDFTYDNFFQNFILFMERTYVQKREYKIQFICDGRVIIDPQFPTQEENGMYINIIDFKSVKEIEEKHREENMLLIKNCVKNLKRKGLSVLPKSYIESYLQNEKTIKIKDINILSEDDNAEDNEITRSTNKLRKKKSDSDILVKFNLSSSSTHFRKRKSGSLKKLNKIKGILRPGRRSISKTNSDLNNSRRVSFGWREESF
jgi:hypothetical protein